MSHSSGAENRVAAGDDEQGRQNDHARECKTRSAARWFPPVQIRNRPIREGSVQLNLRPRRPRAVLLTIAGVQFQISCDFLLRAVAIIQKTLLIERVLPGSLLRIRNSGLRRWRPLGRLPGRSRSSCTSPCRCRSGWCGGCRLPAARLRWWWPARAGQIASQSLQAMQALFAV
jgi:hypothetical protein